jgi:hypothetical protein
VDGLLVVDYPPEECEAFAASLQGRAGPDLPAGAHRTDAAHAQVGRIASGYVYYVSLKGVTGAGHLDTDAVAQMLPRIRAHVRCRWAWVSASATRPPARPWRGGRRGGDRLALVQILNEPDARQCGWLPRRPSWPRSVPRSTRPDEESPCMSWLEKLLPPKIQQTDPAERRTVPEGLWIKCPACETVLYKTDLEQNLNVCPKCSHHHRIGARARLDAFLDPEGRYEIGQEVMPVDPLKFKDSKKYPERLKAPLEPPARPTRWW